jgi:hypothetical protein
VGGLLKLAGVAALGFAAWWFFNRPDCGRKGALECPADKSIDAGVGVSLSRAAVCPGAGYLCFEHGAAAFQVVRWPLDKGKLRVRVPMPEFVEDKALARDLHAAAVEGIMGWDRQPFPLELDTGSRTPLRGADITVHWYQGAGGGHARIFTDVQGARLVFRIDGLQVLVPPVRVDGPIDANLTPDQVMAMGMAALKGGAPGWMTRDQVLRVVLATAAHEMGHALGLRHSDSERDIMFPQFTPGTTPVAPSGRDLRTVESLYSLQNGAMLQ